MITDGLDLTKSTSFWSLTQLGDRAAVTLHLFCNDAHQEELATLASKVGNISELMAALKGSTLLSGTRMLQALTAPVINGITRKPGLDEEVVTLTGSCLAGTTAVTLGGLPVVRFQVVSDAILKVTVALGAHGELLLTTPMGESAPTPLPQPAAISF